MHAPTTTPLSEPNGLLGSLRLLPVVCQDAGKPPILIFDLLDDNVNVLWIFTQLTDQGVRDIANEVGLLLAGRTPGDLDVYVGHRLP